MRKFSTNFFLFCIVIFAFFLRVWRVVEIPPSLSWDEVSIGYNAYSILNTGRDEHGKFLPIDAFASYGDYKPPLLIYLTVPSVAVFGLNEFAVRFPSVVAGTLTVFLTYFLVKELFKKSLYALHLPAGEAGLPLLTSFLLAISPWHIQLSRVGFEANIALSFVVLGVWLVLRARREGKLLLWCWLPLVAAIYTFNSARYFVPLFSLILLVFFWNKFREHTKTFFAGFLISGILLLPIIPHLISKEARMRFVEVNIFSDAGIVQMANNRMQVDDNAWWSKIVHNRRIGFMQSYLSHFLDHFQPWFLFVRGDGNPKFSIQDVGELYIVELPFFVIGILWLLRANRRVAWIAALWIVTAIIPAATARETPHALRIENSLPMWQLFIAFGILSTYNKQQTTKKKIFVTLLIAILYIGNFGYYLHNYYNHYAKEYSGEWQYGYREAILYAQSVKYQYDSVVIDDIIGRPYMYALFYDQYNPKKFQDGVDRSVDGAGFYHVKGFDQYRFVDRAPQDFKKKTLYILRPKLVPENANVQETVRLFNGEPVLLIFDIVADLEKTKTL